MAEHIGRFTHPHRARFSRRVSTSLLCDCSLAKVGPRVFDCMETDRIHVKEHRITHDMVLNATPLRRLGPPWTRAAAMDSTAEHSLAPQVTGSRISWERVSNMFSIHSAFLQHILENVLHYEKTSVELKVTLQITTIFRGIQLGCLNYTVRSTSPSSRYGDTPYPLCPSLRPPVHLGRFLI